VNVTLRTQLYVAVRAALVERSDHDIADKDQREVVVDEVMRHVEVTLRDHNEVATIGPPRAQAIAFRPERVHVTPPALTSDEVEVLRWLREQTETAARVSSGRDHDQALAVLDKLIREVS